MCIPIREGKIMQKFVDASYLDWSRGQKPAIRSKGIAAIVVPQLKAQSFSAVKGQARCIWPSGLENVDSRYLSRRIWSR